MDKAYEQKCKEFFDEFLTPPVGYKTLSLPINPWVIEREARDELEKKRAQEVQAHREDIHNQCIEHWARIREGKEEQRAKNLAEFGTYYPTILLGKEPPAYKLVPLLKGTITRLEEEIKILKRKLKRSKRKNGNIMDRISEEMAAAHTAELATGDRGNGIEHDTVRELDTGSTGLDETETPGEKVFFQDEDDSE